jgi:hypothetical protein
VLSHSRLKATEGLTLAARLAGNQQAKAAVDSTKPTSIPR